MTHAKGFIDFIREKGIVGLAIGFILGGSIGKVVTALVADIISPCIGLLLGSAEGLRAASFTIGSATFLYGDFISTIIDFIIIAIVVYISVKIIGLEKLDKKNVEKN